MRQDNAGGQPVGLRPPRLLPRGNETHLVANLGKGLVLAALDLLVVKKGKRLPGGWRPRGVRLHMTTRRNLWFGPAWPTAGRALRNLQDWAATQRHSAQIECHNVTC